MQAVTHPLIPSTTWSQRFLLGAGALLTVLAGAMLADWALHLRLLTGSSRFDPLPVDASVGYLALGLALIRASRRKATMRWSDAWGVIPALIGGVALLEYALGRDLGLLTWVRQILSSNDIAASTFTTPVQALTLLIGGLGVSPLLIRHPLRQAFVVELAGSLIIAAGCSGLAGEILGLERGIGGAFSPFAGLLTLLLGAALLVQAWRLHGAASDTPPGWLPLPVVVASGALTIMLWLSLRDREVFYRDISTRNAIESLARDITLEIERQSAVLGRIALRWSLLEGTSVIVREADAITFVNEAPGAHALAWLEPAGRTRWFYPASDNESLAGYDHTTDPVRGDALRRARDTSLPSVSGTHPMLSHLAGKRVM